MIKILFLIHDLGQGGAEKVLVNLVNNMDSTKFDISVVSLFGGGVNEQFLKPHIKYRTVFKKAFPGNSKVMKLFSPAFLHKFCIKEHFDIEVSYLEGPSARIISGCQHKDTRLVSWIHSTMKSDKEVASGFRSISEANECYNKFNCTAFVSKGVGDAFLTVCNFKGEAEVIYNTIESEEIRKKSLEDIEDLVPNKIKLISVGTLKEVKGYDRLLRVIKRLKEDGYSVHLYILGIGPMQNEIEEYISCNELKDTITLLGYHTNPYKYIKNCDVFVCSSYSEGFSTAATEALIVGTPVVTTDVSGMKEMFGENNEYGIVTDNNEESLYVGLKKIISSDSTLAEYSKRAEERGKFFSTESTINIVEKFFTDIFEQERYK